MYIVALILRYLRRKLAPIFAILAVTLCTAMVIIVISVMGGFLEMMRTAARTLEGDVIISSDAGGFPHYEQIIELLTGLPGVESATPIIRCFGLVNLSDRVHTVEVLGVEPRGLDAVVGYGKTLHWTKENLTDALERQFKGTDLTSAEMRRHFEAVREQLMRWDLREMGMTLQAPAEWADEGATEKSRGQRLEGIVLGIEVSPDNTRDKKGRYDILNNSTLKRGVTLTVLPMTRKGGLLEPAARRLTVVNEFKSGLYEIDANRAYVPFELLQKMQRMDEFEEVDPETARPTGVRQSARTTSIILRGGEGVELDLLQKEVNRALSDWLAQHRDMPVIYTLTWQEKHARFLGAVEKEKSLLTILFGIISIVAVAMIGVIFYMIVLEKTKDIGVLRAMGASRGGVMAVFMGYGLAIGVVGAFLGFCFAATVVWNINEVQEGLNQFVVWISGGKKDFLMWNPEVYYFDRVPNRMDEVEVAVILAAAVLSSVVGSIVPAILAGRLDPVEALRYE